ncbi:MAG: Smr/MutS family protein [Nitrospiria bacterium]
MHETVNFQAFEPKIDLHGFKVEEGLEHLERFLDQAMLKDEGEVSVIHGHGGGLLKNAVRNYLKTSPYVENYRAGYPWEGGDGVTIVTIRK